MGDEQVEPEMHDSVAVFFCDIVGYTELCGRLSPEKASIVFTMMHTSPRISCIKQTKKLNFDTNMFALTPDLFFVETKSRIMFGLHFCVKSAYQNGFAINFASTAADLNSLSNPVDGL